MSERNDGGPAFPVIETEPKEDRGDLYPHVYSRGGISMRDYFAAKAMQALLISCPPPDYDMDNQDYASDAYAHADAMLKERDK